MRKSTCFAVSALILFLFAGRAWAGTNQSQSLLQLYVISGGWIVWFILVPLSLVTIGLAVGYVLTIRESVLLPEMEENQLTALLSAGQGKRALAFLADKESFLAGVVSAGVRIPAGRLEVLEYMMMRICVIIRETGDMAWMVQAVLIHP